MPSRRSFPLAESIRHCILVLRGRRVLLDADLAGVYGVTTARLNEAVKRNARRFPAEFRFQLTASRAGIFDIAICDIKRGSRRAAENALGFFRARGAHGRHRAP